MAYNFAVQAVNALEAGESGQIVAYKSGSGFELVPVKDVAEGHSTVDPVLMEMCQPLSV